MKDIICNAHYAPGYLYEPILNICPKKGLLPERYSDRFEEYEAYITFHAPELYHGLNENWMHEYYGIDSQNSAFPNFPISEYDTSYWHE